METFLTILGCVAAWAVVYWFIFQILHGVLLVKQPGSLEEAWLLSRKIVRCRFASWVCGGITAFLIWPHDKLNAFFPLLLLWGFWHIRFLVKISKELHEEYLKQKKESLSVRFFDE